MSRSKKHSSDSLEGLKRENRELKQVVKSLQRQIKKLEKEFKPDHNQDDLIALDIQEKKPLANKCTQCERGVVKTTDLGIRTIKTCTICTYREIIKNGEKIQS